LERVHELAIRACGREGIEVWEVEVLGSGRSRVVRVYIDKPSGVTHADCELVSQQLGALLDVEDVIPGPSYQLEVSSPGVERKLRKLEDFQRFAGEKARIALKEPLDNQRRFEGTIHGVEGDEVVFEASTGKSIRVRMEKIDKANLKFDW
jgi:ribosome maturation factor RimP